MTASLNAKVPYGSALHKKLIAALNAREKISSNKMSNQHEKFIDAEEEYMAYVPENEADIKRKARRSSGEMEFTTVHIPYSYAILLSLHTYITSVFLGRTPIMQFAGRHGEPEQSIQGLEALIDYQVNVGRMLPQYYNWFHDAPYYSFGVLWNYWDKEIVQTSRIVEVEPESFMGMPLGKPTKEKQTIQTVGYEGARAMCVHPVDYLPDPRVPLYDPQKGEFVGRKVRISSNDVAIGAFNKRYINAEVLKKMKASKENTLSHEELSGLLESPGEDVGSLCEPTDTGMYEGYEMFVRLIPKDWQLGESSYPEIWAFTVIDKKVIIEARPTGAFHNSFPVDILPNEINHHEFEFRSTLEILEPLNDTLNWLFNTHFFNIRQSLGTNFIVDPSRVVMKDLTRRGVSKLIRLKEEAYGTSIDQVVRQLNVADVTQNHLRDASLVEQMMQRVSGVTDQVMGMMQPGGRKSATEIRTSASFSVNRLKTMSEYWSAATFSQHAQRLVQMTQQYYQDEKKFRIAGDLLAMGNTAVVQVTPEMIAGFYDFVPVDGTLPIDRFAQVNLWKSLLDGAVKMPGMENTYNLPEIFGWIAKLGGLKNIDKFKIQVTPDQQLAAMAQRGNVAKLSEVIGERGKAGRSAEASGGTDRSEASAGSPPTVPGVGPTL